MTLPFLKSSRALLAVLLISMPLSVGADNNEYSKFKIPEAEPADFDSIMEVVDPNESGDADEHIPTNLEEAFCGGWDFLLSVETGENLEGDDLEEELPLEDDFVPG